MNKSKKIAKIINSYFSQEDHKKMLYKDNSIIHIREDMRDVLQYYVMTRDEDTSLDIDEIKARKSAIRSGQSKYIYNGKFIDYEYDREEMINNTQNGFVTHSFNAYNKNKVKRYGLRTDKIRDEELSKDLEYLEEMFGESEFLKTQNKNSSQEMFVSAVGGSSINYAVAHNPERLYLGVLQQDRNDFLPIKVGESKREYLMRVAAKKVFEKCTPEEYNDILSVYERIINKLANDKACIALIPMESEKYEMQISYPTPNIEDRYYETPKEFYKPACTDRFFLSDLVYGGGGQANDGVTVGKNIPASEIGIIEVPDEFVIKQRIAKEKGIDDGKYIDYYSLTEQNYKEDERISRILQEFYQISEKNNSSTLLSKVTKKRKFSLKNLLPQIAKKDMDYNVSNELTSAIKKDVLKQTEKNKDNIGENNHDK